MRTRLLWSSLLVFLLKPVLVLPTSIERVALDDIVTKLSDYFGNLANETLHAEVAQEHYAASSIANFTIEGLIGKLNDNLYREVSNITSRIVAASKSTDRATGGSHVTDECCTASLGKEEPCCQRCSDYDFQSDNGFKSNLINIGLEMEKLDLTEEGVSVQFGSDKAVIIQRPSPSEKCTSEDARAQPWYSFAISKPRVISLALDLTTFISKENQGALLHSLKMFLRSLNPSDRVLLLGFSSDLEELPGCFDFVNANPKNIDTLIKYANTLQARIKTVNGPINTNTAVTHSARFVNNTINGQSGIAGFVVVFTDKESYTATGIMNTVSTYENINFRFVFADDQSSTIVEKDNSQIFRLSDDIIGPVASIVDIRGFSEEPVTWFHSRDRTTGEDFISFVRPSLRGINGQGGQLDLLGVAHIRLPLRAILKPFFEYFLVKPLSYFFVMDSGGNLLYHQLVQRDYVTEVGELEKNRRFRSLVENNSSFDLEITEPRTLALGPSVSEGFITKDLSLKYSCREVFSIKLTLCTVIFEDEFLEYELSTSSYESDIEYHSNVASSPDKCNFNQILAINPPAMGLFGPSTPKKGTDIEEVVQFLKGVAGSGDPPDGVRPDIRADVIVLSELSKRWSRPSQSNSETVLWRHFVSPRGLAGVMPGISLPTNYKPTEAIWYRSAIAFSNAGLTISAAQRDPFGAGFAYGISKKLTIPSVSETAAVVSGQFSLKALIKELDTFESSCTGEKRSCHIFDQAGNVIYTPTFKNVPPERVRTITEEKQYLAHTLQGDKNGIKVRLPCLDYSSDDIFDIQFYNYLVGDEEVNNYNSSTACRHFRFKRIPGTNAIFAIVDDASSCAPLCGCRPICGLSTCSQFTSISGCTCRCYCQKDDYSENICNVRVDSSDMREGVERIRSGTICPAVQSSSPVLTMTYADPVLETCIEQDCSAITNNESCINEHSCLNCNEGCREISACCEEDRSADGFHFCSFPSPSPTSDNIALQTLNIAAIVAPVIIFILLVVVLLGGLMLWYNFRRKPKDSRRPQERLFDFSSMKKSAGKAEDGKAKKEAEAAAEMEEINNGTSLAVKAPEELEDAKDSTPEKEITDNDIPDNDIPNNDIPIIEKKSSDAVV